MNTKTYTDFFFIRSLLSVDGVGPVKLRNLIAVFSEPDFILKASYSELCQVEGISIELAKRIKKLLDDYKTQGQKILKEIEQLERLNARYLTFLDADYPDSLKKIYDPPLILYIKGEYLKEDINSLAVIGTRIPTAYGRHVVVSLTGEIIKAGVTIVSGLARGIDTLAHKSALQAGGRTIAVLGSGLDNLYPAENKKLAEEITNRGAVITEYPPGTLPEAGNFPRRNRIIAGLSKGVLIVETGLTGGAIITANYALDQGREVFAVPGNIGVKQSEGTNALIQKGEAKLVTRAEDVFVELGIKLPGSTNNDERRKLIDNLNLFEQKLLQSLSNEPVQIDTIATLTSLSISDCLVYLLSLEFKGLIRQLPGKMFVLE